MVLQNDNVRLIYVGSLCRHKNEEHNHTNDTKKLKRFHVKRIYSTLLLSYGALLAAPFIAVFLLLSFWKNSN